MNSGFKVIGLKGVLVRLNEGVTKFYLERIKGEFSTTGARVLRRSS
jgi:hypothetical protein